MIFEIHVALLGRVRTPSYLTREIMYAKSGRACLSETAGRTPRRTVPTYKFEKQNGTGLTSLFNRLYFIMDKFSF